LNQWGGHDGQADDYHYHSGSVHLEKFVGAGNQVAVALDGYQMFSYNDPNGKPLTNLDCVNDQKGPGGGRGQRATSRGAQRVATTSIKHFEVTVCGIESSCSAQAIQRQEFGDRRSISGLASWPTIQWP